MLRRRPKDAEVVSVIATYNLFFDLATDHYNYCTAPPGPLAFASASFPGYFISYFNVHIVKMCECTST